MSPKKLLSIQNSKSLAGSWLFTILWCAISFPAFFIFGFKERDLMGGAISGLFTLFGVAMLYAAIKGTLEYLKYGEVHLSLEGEQPTVGQAFSARLNLPAAAADAEKIHAELACVRVTWTRGSKGGASKGELDAWARQYVFPARRSGVGVYAALRVEIPPDQPVSDLPEESVPDAVVSAGHPGEGVEIGRDYHRWELRIKADVPGIDFERTFQFRVSAGKQAASACPATPRLDPVMASPELHERLLARRLASRRLGTLCAVIAIAPFVAPFAIAGIAVGLAGCPMSWNSSRPPACEFAGINWGPLMAGAFDLMFYAAPVGIGLALLINLAGEAWLSRGRSGSRQLVAPLIGLVVLSFFVYQLRQFMPASKPAQPVAPGVQQPIAAARDAPGTGAAQGARVPASSGSWEQQGNAEDGLKRTLASVESNSPAAALALYRLSLEYERQKRTADQEQALLRALAILEIRADADVKAELGAGGNGLDKEVVARRLADIYWDQRRYDRAYVHYDRAYGYAREVLASDDSLNLRLARNSAGRMAAACMLGNWDIADSAMAELKERIVKVDAAEQKRLEYWIRTGEPRLAARKC